MSKNMNYESYYQNFIKKTIEMLQKKTEFHNIIY